MTIFRFEKLVPRDVYLNISPEELKWLRTTFNRLGQRYPTLEELWQLMDESWRELGCDPAVMDERIGQYYAHPVWLLNGLFIEQHEKSLENRRCFTDWVAQQNPLRIADYGGGYGSLARMIGARCPKAVVEIIEPHPHPAAIALARQTMNVRYRPELSGEYDILIATDVFEHVPDPLSLAAETADYLCIGGHYLIANCFQPVILCHLPQTFHFRWTWDAILKKLGLEPMQRVLYGREFQRNGNINLCAARLIEKRSKSLFTIMHRLPRHIAKPLSKVLMAVWYSRSD